MFVRYYGELALSAGTAAEVLLRAPERWIPALASSADARGQRLLAEVGFPVRGRRLGKQVVIEIGKPVETPGRTWLPISWRATGPQGLFPALEGELEVAPVGTNVTQLGLSARYEPPFGLLGKTLDRALLHRIAEATIRDFVERVRVALQRQAAA
jgi:hypothetical protein